VDDAEAPGIARDVHHPVIAGLSRCAPLTRSTMVATDPPPFGGRVSSETLRLLHQARQFGPHLIARFVLDRCVAGSLIASGIAEAMARHCPSALAVQVGQPPAAGRFLCGGQPSPGTASRQLESRRQ
jgi:chromosome partitioning protein